MGRPLAGPPKLTGEGLLLEPEQRPLRGQRRFMFPTAHKRRKWRSAWPKGTAAQSQLARRLAENGCRVIVPTLIDRQRQFSVIAHGQRKADVTHRELLNRPAYEMGRTLIGLEIQKILAAFDALPHERYRRPSEPQAVVGYGEGGLLALYAGALDPADRRGRHERLFRSPQGRSGANRSIAICSACSMSSAMRRSPRSSSRVTLLDRSLRHFESRAAARHGHGPRPARNAEAGERAPANSSGVGEA